MKSIPDAALPVVELLRRDVPDPGPPDDEGRWWCRCPLALHPTIKKLWFYEPPPDTVSCILGVSETAAECFINWWDGDVIDHADAYRLIWPEKETR